MTVAARRKSAIRDTAYEEVFPGNAEKFSANNGFVTVLHERRACPQCLLREGPTAGESQLRRKSNRGARRLWELDFYRVVRAGEVLRAIW